MSAEKKKQKKVLGLVVGLVVVLFGGLLFMGAVSGWFDNPKAELDDEYICANECDEDRIMDISAEEYEELIKKHKSFVILIDQGGCTTADRLRGYIDNYAKEAGIKVYRIMFDRMKESSLHEYVKYYPSVAVISKGRVIGYLRADSDDDADMYNDEGAFKTWIQSYL